MACSSVASSNEPSWRTPLMKNVGVPLTLLRMPLLKSSSTRPRNARLFMSSTPALGVGDDALRITHERLAFEVLLVFEQRIVHLPKLPLGSSGFSGLGRAFGERVCFAQRKISEHEAEMRAKSSLNRLHDRIRLPTIRALVVAVFDERDASAGVALNVITITDDRCELGHGSAFQCVERFENAIRAWVDRDGRYVAPAHDSIRNDE